MSLDIPHLRELMEKAHKTPWSITDAWNDAYPNLVDLNIVAVGSEWPCIDRQDAELTTATINNLPELLRLAEIGQRVEGEKKSTLIPNRFSSCKSEVLYGFQEFEKYLLETNNEMNRLYDRVQELESELKNKGD